MLLSKNKVCIFFNRKIHKNYFFLEAISLSFSLKFILKMSAGVEP